MANALLQQRRRRRRRPDRKGAVLSLELLLILPILWVMCFGLVEISMLLMSVQRIQTASSAACRVGTLPADDSVAQEQAMKDAAARALGNASLVATFEMRARVGQYAGDPVVVTLSVPMTAAAPDLLKAIGFSLKGRQLVAQSQMCKQ